ncbi:MAG: sugar phosphate isomerase/epimerase, partial [Ktedonobacteraceae bacterium]|nr:sugar phosphate isomerase/epimerase [Ktedonobacteraceae bacterium]
MTQQNLGLQLYTVRDETARDFRQTLRSVAEIGYQGVEFAGYGSIPSKEMAALLSDLNLRAQSTHVGLDALEADLDAELNYCLDIGCSYLVLPYLGGEWRSAENLLKLATRLNEIGRESQQRGITFAYHNHDFEFQQANGSYLLDLLLDATDPAYVKLELDTYWAAYAGADTIAYLRKRAGRVPLIHLKDMTAQRTFAEVGDGTLDISGFIKAAKEGGAEYFFVENDQPTIPSLESARR